MWLTPFRAGVIGIVLVIGISYGAYTKFGNPFASPYTTSVIFPNANGLRQDALVRIAGVNIGKVQSIQPVKGCTLAPNSDPQQQCTAAKITMAINDNGLPLHKDATFWIRPRIFLEGNFFIDVNPGTPEAPVAPEGYTFPIQSGREPVQLDQVLTTLQSDTRRNLQILLQQYGKAVKEGGPAFNESIQYWTPAYLYGAQVSHDTLGTQPHDLSKWIDKAGVVNGALDHDPQNLKSLITDLNTTANAFASQSTALQNAIAELPRTLKTAMPALNALETAFCDGPQVPNCSPGPARRFARALIPGVRTTGPMVDASLPFFHQLRLLVQPSELQGLVHDLSYTVPSLGKLNAATIPFAKNEVRPASSCQTNVILPWTHMTVPDQTFNASDGVPPHPVYVEGVDFLPGLNGEMRDFDANGPYIRVILTGGTLTYSFQPGLFGTALTAIQGVQPQMPALHTSGDGARVPVSRPPLKPDVPCETQPKISSLYAPIGAGPQPISASGDTTAAGRARMQSGGMIELAQLENQAKEQGLKMNFTKSLNISK